MDGTTRSSRNNKNIKLIKSYKGHLEGHDLLRPTDTRHINEDGLDEDS